MSGGSTVEMPRVAGPDSGLGGSWRVIVLNDDHNTFEGVAQALARVLPGVSYDGGMAMANTIHRSGRGAVRVLDRAQREPAELYWEQLEQAGLTHGPARAGLASKPPVAASSWMALPEPTTSWNVGSSGTW